MEGIKIFGACFHVEVVKECFRLMQSVLNFYELAQFDDKAAFDLSARYFILPSAANYILTSTHMFQVPVSSRLALQLQCGAVYESCS